MQVEGGEGRTGGSTKRMGNLSSAFEKANTSAAYSYVAMNYMSTLGICFQIGQQMYEVAL